MTVMTESRINSAVRAAETLLSHRAGSPVVLDDPEDLGGSGRTTVVRVRVAQNPLSLDRSLVIKALPGDEDPQAFHREIAAYKFATALPNESRPGPQLIASDAGHRLMVLTDLGYGRSMSDLLFGVDPVETSRAISAWGQALGRMHAATFGGEPDFLALLRLGPSGTGDRDPLREEARGAAVGAHRIAEHLGVEIPDLVVDALSAGAQLFDEGEHRAFSPSDVGPENILINGSGVQFMDYEWGGFRDATLDIAYALVTLTAQLGPSDVARAGELEISMVDAWQSEVAAIWPGLGRAREMHRKVLTARLLWVWVSTTWLLPGEVEPIDPDDAAGSRDWALHTDDPRVIVARWTDLAVAAERAGARELADFATTVGVSLQRTWLA